MMARETSVHAGRLKGGAGAVRGGKRVWTWPIRRVGASARQLLLVPPDPWPGDAARGQEFLAAPPPAWGASTPAAIDANRFAWLRDLRAVGSDAARRRAQDSVRTWIARGGFGHPRLARSPRVVADRLVHWMGQFDFFGKPAPLAFKTPFFKSLAHQARALARALPRIAATTDRVRALRALVCFGAAVPGAQNRLALARQHLQPLLEAWPEDGMTPERNPSLQLAVLRDLVDIRAFLHAAHHEPPAALEPAIARAARALAAMRHGDGALALFHGGIEEDAAFCDVVLALAGVGAALPARFSGGYQRAVRGDAVLIFDAALPPSRGHDRGAHAGTLAFEFGAGGARLVVNCGASRIADPKWRDAGRVTAAHSTLVLDDRNSTKIISGDGLRSGPTAVTCDRQDDASASWLAATHDGYVRRFGLLHRRRLFLAQDGGDLRGEDRLEPPPGQRVPRRARGRAFAIRFHLHPAVTVGEPARHLTGGTVIPFGTAASGAWQLAADGAYTAVVEESFYLGDGATPRRAKQLVITGLVDGETGADARWAIRRAR